ncbi:MAG: GNAT family N-acetyltransferase [Actinomycetota bacterium]|nr:GNAT family N-acetyltransferase [Actinomycetota bacterium]
MAEIRECSMEDFPAVIGLLEQLWPDRDLYREGMRRAFQRGLDSDNQHYICAVEGNQVVAFGTMTIVNSMWQQGYVGNIDEFVVDEGCRGRGIGGMLLEHLVDIAGINACKTVTVESALHRDSAHRFYETRGYERKGLVFIKEIGD